METLGWEGSPIYSLTKTFTMDTQDDYKKFDLESMYQFYLKKMKLDERFMTDKQRIERKRAWFSGFSMGMLSVVSDSPDTQEEFDSIMKNMMKQITDFFEKTLKEQEVLQGSNN